MPETDSILATLEENAVLETLNEYAVAYCAKDLDRLMAVFDDCEDISLIGTGADELCAGRSEVAAVFQRNFEEATTTRFERGWTHSTVDGDHAVVAAAITIHLLVEDEKN